MTSSLSAQAAAARAELVSAAAAMRQRGLAEGARWALELAAGVAGSSEGEAAVNEGAGSDDSGFGGEAGAGAAVEPEPCSAGPYVESHAGDAGGWGVREEQFELARCYFDAGEFARCEHALQAAKRGAPLFLQLHAAYRALERRREEERVENAGPLGEAPAGENGAGDVELAALEARLAALRIEGAAGEHDPFLAFLHGSILRRLERSKDAAVALASSVRTFPCNWQAWTQLAPLCHGGAGGVDAAPLHLPRHFARQAFEAHVCLEGQRNERALALYRALARLFPGAAPVANAVATCFYNMRDFGEAQARFGALLERDPHRVEGMDTYSNILYVSEQWATLSHLAHRVVRTDKYRPETCCVVGNYYSLRAEHEKAVLYFRRALRLDRRYLSAWTLMGHEYVEMKNTPAAIDAYRRAVDINPRDYRAWYGLGQTYEIMHMPYYSLYYYRRAAQLRPSDARMWCAMGQCYESEQLGLREHAARCYRRALDNREGEGLALHKLAKLHQAMGDDETAAEYHAKILESLNVRVDFDLGVGGEGGRGGLDGDAAMELSSDDEGAAASTGGGVTPLGAADGSAGGAPGGQDAVDALLFMAEHSVRTGRLEAAMAYATRLLDYSSDAKETAKAILREVAGMRAGSSEAGGEGVGGMPEPVSF